MNDDTNTTEAPTRREYVKYGGGVVGGSLLAGCAGQSDSGLTPTETSTDETTETDKATPEDASWTVTMSPIGELTFKGIPQNVAVYDPQWADVLVALGHEEKINSLGFPELYYTGYYDELQGVSFDTSGLTKLYDGGLDKEVFYELNSDLHHLDPVKVANLDGWSEADVEEITGNVAPWFANRFSRENSLATYGGVDADQYEFYTLWELTEKFAQVYKQEEKAAALRTVHEDLVETVQFRLPPEEERPTVALIYWSESDGFWPYELVKPGFGQSQYRPLQPKDVFAGSDVTYGSEGGGGYVGYETLLELDPEIIIFSGGALGNSDLFEEMRKTLPEHSVGSELTAVKNDRLYAGGSPLQGPIYQTFQIEMAAKQIYPEQFGEWPSVGEVPEGEQLFDRERMSDIVNGVI